MSVFLHRTARCTQQLTIAETLQKEHNLECRQSFIKVVTDIQLGLGAMRVAAAKARGKFDKAASVLTKVELRLEKVGRKRAMRVKCEGVCRLCRPALVIWWHCRPGQHMSDEQMLRLLGSTPSFPLDGGEMVVGAGKATPWILVCRGVTKRV